MCIDAKFNDDSKPPRCNYFGENSNYRLKIKLLRLGRAWKSNWCTHLLLYTVADVANEKSMMQLKFRLKTVSLRSIQFPVAIKEFSINTTHCSNSFRRIYHLQAKSMIKKKIRNSFVYECSSMLYVLFLLNSNLISIFYPFLFDNKTQKPRILLGVKVQGKYWT